jgi:hypothetical protein
MNSMCKHSTVINRGTIRFPKPTSLTSERLHFHRLYTESYLQNYARASHVGYTRRNNTVCILRIPVGDTCVYNSALLSSRQLSKRAFACRRLLLFSSQLYLGLRMSLAIVVQLAPALACPHRRRSCGRRSLSQLQLQARASCRYAAR